MLIKRCRNYIWKWYLNGFFCQNAINWQFTYYSISFVNKGIKIKSQSVINFTWRFKMWKSKICKTKIIVMNK